MKKFVTASLITVMLASLGSCGKNANTVDQEYIYGKIDSVSGNDVVLLLADYNEETNSTDNKNKTEKNISDETGNSNSENKKSRSSNDEERSRSFKMPENGEMPDGFDPEKYSGEKPEGFTRPENGEIPEDFNPEKFGGKMPGNSSNSDDDGKESRSRNFKKPENGEMPEGFDPEKFSGRMPGNFSNSDDDGENSGSRSFKIPENGEMPEGFSKSGDGEKTKSFSRSKDRKSSGNSKYTLTGEQEELRIPVGTTVTTSLGVKTDFDALSAGDIIKCSVEKDSNGKEIVTEVWIIEQ